MLAGISPDYYLRLEQGRDTHPSVQVLDALARALRLDIKATDHLHRLAGSTGGSRSNFAVETVAADLNLMVDQLPIPAIVANRYLDVLVANPVARALSSGFTPGENFLRWRLLAPAAREVFLDWNEATEGAVSGLREAAGSDADDPRLRELVDDLSAHSDRFRELWVRADVGYQSGVTRLQHPAAGELQLHRFRLSVPYSDGQHLLTYFGEPGSETAKALEVLRDSIPADNP